MKRLILFLIVPALAIGAILAARPLVFAASTDPAPPDANRPAAVEAPRAGAPPHPMRPAATSAAPLDWRVAEKGILEDHVQLTFSDRFVKAGESYFSPDNSKIIFQAVEQPPQGQKADEIYAMFVADVKREAASGTITGLQNIRRLSPKGSANTCGWFHPTDPNVVLFASTIGPPTESSPPGYQRASGQYRWSFPPEMRIVRCELDKADGTAASLTTLVGDGKAYCAEDSLSPDARHLLHCSLQSGDGDLFVKDLKTSTTTCIVQAKGYDGGPFFSPDGKRICYRSNRLGDDMLQLFVADLAFNDAGTIVGVKREYQLTDEACVNWCPFWTHDGRHLIYSSSLLGEMNFEIYLIDADPGDLPGSTGTVKYGAARRRLTHFEPTGSQPASDVLPALSTDGAWMIWASRRSDDGSVQLWAAKFVLNPDAPWKPQPAAATPAERRDDGQHITITDPDTGRIFVYDLATHALSEYDMKTHTLSEVKDLKLIDRFMQLYQASQKK